MGAPAIVKIGSGPFLYAEAGVEVDFQNKTGDIVSSMFGKLGEYVESQKTIIKLRPVGMLTAGILTSAVPLGVAIGASCMAGAVEVWTKDGAKTIWTRGGVTGSQELTFTTKANVFSGDMEITCLGAATGANTTAGHWNAITAPAFADTSFDATKINGDRYVAAYGASPFDAITAQDGFKLTIERKVAEIPDANIGIKDIELTDLFVKLGFIPSNLTETQVWALVNLQSTGARMPGDKMKSSDDLVITGAGNSGLTVTLNKPGFTMASLAYEPGKLRTQMVSAVPSRTFTTGAPDALVTFALA